MPLINKPIANIKKTTKINLKTITNKKFRYRKVIIIKEFLVLSRQKDRFKIGVGQGIILIWTKNDPMYLGNQRSKIRISQKLKSSKPKLNCKTNQVNCKKNLQFQRLLEEFHQDTNKTRLIIKILSTWPEVLLILENIKEKTHSETKVSCLKVLLLIKIKMNIIIIKKNQDLHLAYQGQIVTCFSTWLKKSHWSITKAKIKILLTFYSKKETLTHFIWICWENNHRNDKSHC